MATYRLLRNNKESGPHTLDELRQMGLKAYDLVWIDGKSAAWRYPGEVEELKSFSPQVVEQPYDRFYKKQTEEKQPEVIKQEVQQQPSKVQEAYAVAPEHEKYIPKKSVFVTMPGKKTNGTKRVTQEETYKPVTPAVQQKAVPVTENPISVTENPVAAQVKYSQPLDEIKEMYVKTLYDRKQRIARKTFWLQSLKKVAVILFLVALGVVAGFFIRSKGNNSTALLTETEKSQSVQQPAATNNVPPVVADPVNSSPENTQPATGSDEPQLKEIAGTTNETKETNTPVTGTSRLKLVPLSNNSNTENNTTDPSSHDERNTATSPGAVTDPNTGERGRRSRTTETGAPAANKERERKSFSGSDVADQVSVKSNEYKRVAFGGIRNLELTVTNDSKYTLDNVVVELQYIKPNELPLKTEKIEFKSIGPKSTSTIRVPDTNRGIKVTYRIINIRSSQMDELTIGNKQ